MDRVPGSPPENPSVPIGPDESQGIGDIHCKVGRLHEILRSNAPLLIAYSGGVDSTFLLAEAHDLLRNQVLGVIADSPSLPRKALAAALDQAKGIGAQIRLLKTNELQNSDYFSNPINRCYFCKFELFDQMFGLAKELGFRHLAYGENFDDALVDRPGSKAAQEFHVITPLRDARLTKAEIRYLSRQRDLPTADLPAQPCLSSRIPTGTRVTTRVLGLIEQAEEIVRSYGFSIFRVRYLPAKGNKPNAKIQVDPKNLAQLLECSSALVSKLKKIGFAQITIDPDGYRAPERLRLVPEP